MLNKYEEQLATDRVVLLKSSFNSATGDTFRTFLVRFPKILLQELNTHRQLVRNCGSSRAIPTKTLLDRIREDTYIPNFTSLCKGMVGEPIEDKNRINTLRRIWLSARDNALESANQLLNENCHKQDVNRLLEPFSYVDLLLSGTEWDNFLKLRTASDTQPAFRDVALKIKKLIEEDKPVELMPGQWHIPFLDSFYSDLSQEENKLVAIARIARVSYLRYGSTEIELQKDIDLAKSLLDSGHMSPLEHVACAVDSRIVKGYGFKTPSKVKKFLFHASDIGMTLSTRQYAGFYTYRASLEDNYDPTR